MKNNELLKYKLPLISLMVDKKLIEKVNEWFEHWKEHSNIGIYREGSDNSVFLNFLLFKVDELIVQFDNILHLYTKFRKKYAKAVDEQEKNDVVIDFGVDLVSFEKGLYKDKEALNRWMGDDAVNERFDKLLIEIKKAMIFIIKRIGVIFKYHCKPLDSKSSKSYWEKIDIMKHLNPLIDIQTDTHILNSVLDTIAESISCIASEDKNDKLLKKQHERFIYRLCLETNQDVWVQSSALKILFFLSRDFFLDAAKKRLTNYIEGDDIFVRNRILQIISQAPIDEEFFELVKIASEDKSEFVRQGVFKLLEHVESNEALLFLESKLLKENKDSVSTYALDCLNYKKIDEYAYGNIISKFLKTERSIYITRYTLHCIYEYILQSKSKSDFNQLILIIENVVSNHKEINLRRYAGEYLLLINTEILLSSNEALKQLHNDLNLLQSGKSLKVSNELVKTKGFDQVLSSLALNSFPFELIKTIFGYKVYKGERINSMLWRFIYETKNTSPDKRESHDHTLGRDYEGAKLYLSNKLSEVTPTKVPDEPVHQSYDGGWLNYIPLVSHIHHAIKRSFFSKDDVVLLTSQGETSIKIKGGILKRISLYFWSIFNFSKIALQRTDTVQKNTKPQSFRNYLKKKGIEIDFKEYTTKDSSIAQFFSVAVILNPVEYYIMLEDYFISAYENTLFELAIFTLAITFVFLYGHRRKYKKLKIAREEIPLVIGGWGTRGKSGTERIKAAMFNSLGYNIVSKTTGCEAMFLHSRGYSSLKEMFLFRPYDKATIWEQYDLVKLSAKMDTDIFLWECMALTPSYVNILQQEWMNDDISTITNTYPDHENLQGPSGRDIPEVMKNFIPQNSVLFTSEEEMTPLLREDSIQKNTIFKSVGWKESGKIADDILQRFSYDEHPYNIALVNELGKYLQLDEDLALKSMADLVIADIGVLKTFPIAHYNNRYIQFINGMSANERFGTLSNWKRVGLYNYTLESNPDVFISTVINNRADRVSRSRVFADIVAFDLNADLHFLIGSNQNGFLVYVKESFHYNKDKLYLFKDDDPLKEFDRLCDIYRIPKTKLIAKNRTDIIEKDNNEHEQVSIFVQNISDDLEFYLEIRNMIEQNQNKNQIQTIFEEKLLKRLLNRIISVEDLHASGDEIIHIISKHTPYNMTNKIMGLQNIKGTGLDFVYRFLNWEQCYNSCQKIISPKKAISLDGIGQLGRFKEFGPLSFEYVKEILNEVSKTQITQSEYYQAQIDNILNFVETMQKQVKYASSNNTEQNKVVKLVMETIESFLDAGDAIKRKKKVEQVYDDLISYRISHERAAVELKKVNKRQKGGWFLKQT